MRVLCGMVWCCCRCYCQDCGYCNHNQLHFYLEIDTLFDFCDTCVVLKLCAKNEDFPTRYGNTLYGIFGFFKNIPMCDDSNSLFISYRVSS